LREEKIFEKEKRVSAQKKRVQKRKAVKKLRRFKVG